METLNGKTILIIGAGLLQIPAIERAKAMGLYTIASDYRSEACGIPLADDSIIISTRDVDGTVREARKYSREKRPIHGVITVGTDASMTVAAVASALNLPGIKFCDAEAASNKLKMRARLKEHAVPCPDYFECWTEEEAITHFHQLRNTAVVVKPADNMGSRGVSMASNEQEVRRAFAFAKNATPSGEVIIEEYMPGPELSIDALIYNGESHITGIADRIIDKPPYFVETGHIMPSNLPAEALEDAVRVMKDGIQALGINLGAAKGDIKVTPEGAKVGEIAARLSGGFMSAYTFPYATGIDLVGKAIRIAMGEEPGDLVPELDAVSMEAALIPGAGRVAGISGIASALALNAVKHIFINIEIGDTLVNPRCNVEKAGHIIVQADSREAAIQAVEKARTLIQFNLEKR